MWTAFFWIFVGIVLILAGLALGRSLGAVLASVGVCILLILLMPCRSMTL
jgi:hypothetical protein